MDETPSIPLEMVWVIGIDNRRAKERRRYKADLERRFQIHVEPNAETRFREGRV
jgi:hypothetical protein